MAATVTRTPLQEVDKAHLGERVSVAWTSDGSGNATASLIKLRGWIVKVITYPGSAAPTDDYDIKLKDSTGFDVLGSVLNDRDTSNTEQIPTPNSGVSIVTYVNGDYTFDVSNAGSAKNGTCVFYIKTK